MNIQELIKKLRDHERHAVHDYDDDCDEAADTIERLNYVYEAALAWRSVRYMATDDEAKAKRDLDDVLNAVKTGE